MKTLNTIQNLSKLGIILSRILFIFCLIGAIGCLVGIISLLFFCESFKLGGVTIQNIVVRSPELNLGTTNAYMAAGFVLCVGEALQRDISKTKWPPEHRSLLKVQRN